MLVFATATAFCAAQSNPQHDIQMMQVGAPNSIVLPCKGTGGVSVFSPKVFVNGTDDYQFASGALSITFTYGSDQNTQPNVIGTLPVTFASSDPPLLLGMTWPDDFPGATNTSKLTWKVPTTLPDSITIRAQVNYPAGITGYPSDNVNYATVSTETQVSCSNPIVGCNSKNPPARCTCADNPDAPICWCPGASGSPLCRTLCQNYHGGGLPPSWCGPEAAALRQPIKPVPVFNPCKLTGCPPCMAGGDCGPGEWEILLQGDPESSFVLVSGEGVKIADSQKLAEPVKVGSNTFNYSIRFTPAKDVKYLIQVLSPNIQGGLKSEPVLTMRRISTQLTK
jgi:hypothetical protein